MDNDGQIYSRSNYTNCNASIVVADGCYKWYNIDIPKVHQAELDHHWEWNQKVVVDESGRSWGGVYLDRLWHISRGSRGLEWR